MSNKYQSFFDNLAITNREDYNRSGWSSQKSMESRFAVFTNQIDLSLKNNLLDIGCGPGNLEVFLEKRYKNLEIQGIDISKPMLDHARNKKLRSKFTEGIITEIPFRNNSFDCVVCLGVLQNFDGKIEKAIEEIFRIVKEDGDVFITTIDRSYEGYVKGEMEKKDFFVYYEPKLLCTEFEKIGFKIENCQSFSTETSEILPLHKWNKFFIHAVKK